VSYFDQILQNAKANGGLSDEQFNALYKSYMPQQQIQPNLGMSPSNAPMTGATIRPIAKNTNVAGQGGAGIDTQAMTSVMKNNPQFGGLIDRAMIANEYDINMFSDQAKDIAEQNKGIDDWRTKMRDGLMSYFS
jgi:hypothetical protein